MTFFFNFQATSNHLHPLQVENCDSNSWFVVDEEDNGKLRLERVKHPLPLIFVAILCRFANATSPTFGSLSQNNNAPTFGALAQPSNGVFGGDAAAGAAGSAGFGGFNSSGRVPVISMQTSMNWI